MLRFAIFFTFFMFMSKAHANGTTTFDAHLSLPEKHQMRSLFEDQDEGIRKFIRDLYAGELTPDDIKYLNATLQTNAIKHLNHWYLHDKLYDECDINMPDWDIKLLRRLAVLGPLLFTTPMTDEDKTALLITLYYSDLLKCNDIRQIIQALIDNYEKLCLGLVSGKTSLIIKLIESASAKKNPRSFIYRVAAAMSPLKKLDQRISYVEKFKE